MQSHEPPGSQFGPIRYAGAVPAPTKRSSKTSAVSPPPAPPADTAAAPAPTTSRSYHGSAFRLVSEHQPAGDQPRAIAELVAGVQRGDPAQVLLGITGSGKTFTIANVIAQTGKPTLIMAHNKVLAAQLHGEFKALFPDNAVHYFVSYYDYYQPEAYVPTSDPTDSRA